MLKRIAKYVVGGALVLLFAMGPLSLYFWYEIPTTPTVPDPARGFVFPYNNHGVTHYVTWFDNLLSNAFGYAVVIVFPILVVAIMWALSRRKS